MSKFNLIARFGIITAILLGSCLNISAADTEDLFNKGMAEFKAENYEEASVLLEKAYKENPGDPKIVLNLALVHREMQNMPEAVRYLKETIKLDPSVSEPKYLLADSLYGMASYEEALSAVDIALKDGVKTGPSFYLRGLIFQKLNRNKEAVAAFNKAKELDPSLKQQSDYQIASIYVQEQNYKKAGETFKGLISVDPTSDWAAYSKDYLAALEKIPAPYRLNVGLGIQYDDNVLGVPIDGALTNIARQEDWKKLYSLFGEYTVLSQGAWNVKTSYSLNIVQHGKSDYTKNDGSKVFSQDTVSHIISVLPSYNTSKSITGLLMSYSYLEVDYIKYMETVTVNPLHTLIISGNHIGQVFLRYKNIQYDAEFMMRRFGTPLQSAEDRDSSNYGVGAAYFYTKGMLFNLKAEADMNYAAGSNWDYRGFKASAGLMYPIVNNLLKANIFLENYFQKFTNTHTTYGVKRRDSTMTFQANLTYMVSKPFDVSAGYAHIKDDSNIGVYEYRKNLYTLNLEYRF